MIGYSTNTCGAILTPIHLSCAGLLDHQLDLKTPASASKSCIKLAQASGLKYSNTSSTNPGAEVLLEKLERLERPASSIVHGAVVSRELSCPADTGLLLELV